MLYKGILSVILVSLLIPTSAQAELFKYTNDDGVTVLDSQVPPRYVRNGYTVMSDTGRVIEVVPRALTAAERASREKLLAEKRQAEERQKRQAIEDENLLRLYSRPADIIRARDSKIASIDGFIKSSESNIERLKYEESSLKTTLASVVRSGGIIGKSQVDKLRGLEQRIRQIQREINSKQQEMAEVRATFANDLRRLTEIYQNVGNAQASSN